MFRPLSAGRLCWLLALGLACGCIELTAAGGGAGGAAGSSGGGAGQGAGGAAGAGGAGGAGGLSPQLVIGAPDPGGIALAVAATEDLSLIVRESHVLVAFGKDAAGWFGPPTAADEVLAPTIVALDVATVTASRHGVAWLDPAGGAWFLGTAPASFASVPDASGRLALHSLGAGPFVELHLGDGHAVAIDRDGAAWGAGDGRDGSLGLPSGERTMLAPLDLSPAAGGQFPDEIVQVRALAASTFLLTKTGLLLRLGDDLYGLDGSPDGDDDVVWRPVELDFARACTGVDGPAEAVVALCGGKLVTWGIEILGRLGQSTTAVVEVRDDAEGPPASRLLGATPFATFFVGPTGDLQSFGAAALICRDAVLDPTGATLEPGPVAISDAAEVVEVVGGLAHTLILMSTGRVLGCGTVDRGALGAPTAHAEQRVRSPLEVPLVAD